MKAKHGFLGILVLIAILTLAACDNSDDGGSPSYEYGPGGGIIFYKNEAGFTVYQYAGDTTGVTCHYLEAALYDISPRAWASGEFPYGYTQTNIEGTSTDFGTGKRNTAVILAVDSDAPAAKACNDYIGKDGYNDWFLPSKDELYKLYEFYAAHGKGSYANLKYNKWYWSSSQYNDTLTYAWHQGFDNSGNQMQYYKYMDTTIYVRAIRAF